MIYYIEKIGGRHLKLIGGGKFSGEFGGNLAGFIFRTHQNQGSKISWGKFRSIFCESKNYFKVTNRILSCKNFAANGIASP